MEQLSDNLLSFLPPQLGELKELRNFDISNNQLTLDSLAPLIHLELIYLNVSGNMKLVNFLQTFGTNFAQIKDYLVSHFSEKDITEVTGCKIILLGPEKVGKTYFSRMLRKLNSQAISPGNFHFPFLTIPFLDRK